MALPVPKVEVGFNIVRADSPFFTLDDVTKGVLDDPTYPLSGTIFYDVTDKVKSVTIRRGKNRQLDEFNPGLANIVFINTDRAFDPEYPDSPYFGQIIPKREVRITSEGEIAFVGFVDDWNLSYTNNGYSEASAACSDAFSSFRNQNLPLSTATAQLPGARLESILDSSEVNWPEANRNIEIGNTLLGTDVITEGTNALSYMRLVAKSEPGQLFVSKDGALTFKDRNLSSSPNYLTFSDDGTGIGYQTLKVVYGSELLYNEITLTNYKNDVATASEVDSIGEYGVFSLNQEGLLIENGSDLVNIALLQANKYSQPEYRFEEVTLVLDKYDPPTQKQILGLEIGDVVAVRFTPNDLPPAIEKFAEVIRIDHAITPTAHIMTLGFSTIENNAWTLSDVTFGRLSADNILTF